jgi:peptidoglycan hydrolase-like protein with peptidoglycan-binding domain
MKSGFFMMLFIIFLCTGVIFAQNNKELFLVKSGQRMSGPDVERLQKYLAYNGIDIGPDGVDGWFGKDTDKALREFQKKQKLKVTGRIDVKDIPQELDLKTALKEWDADKPPQKRDFSKRLVKEGVIKTWFGKITVKADPQYEEELFELALSPSERFVTYLAFSPMIDMQLGQPLVVTDILTGKNYAVNALQIFTDLNDEYEFGKLFTETDSSQILTYYWISDNELYMAVEVNPYEGKSLRASGVLVIKR